MTQEEDAEGVGDEGKAVGKTGAEQLRHNDHRDITYTHTHMLMYNTHTHAHTCVCVCTVRILNGEQEEMKQQEALRRLVFELNCK